MKKRLFILIIMLSITQKSLSQISFCGEDVPINSDLVKKKLIAIIRKNIRTGGLSTELIQTRTRKYLPFITDVLHKYNMPDDLKFLALVESRLNPAIYSPAGAAGMWQFMPATAIQMGLNISAEVDERNNVIRSTHAACRYLLYLYKNMGSWTLAAASYNAGEGRINKAVKKQGTSNYYKMSLNSETGAYLYEIVAMKLMYEYSQSGKLTQLYKEEQENILVKGGSSQIERNPDKDDQIKEQEVQINLPLHRNSVGVVFTQLKTESITLDSLIPATILKGTYIQKNGIVYLRTMKIAKINGTVIKENTIIKGVPYADTGRLKIDIAGVDISPSIKQFKASVFDVDGLEGLAIVNSRGNKQIAIQESSRVVIKFTTEHE